MRIAVDAMGSDAFPIPDIAGAVEAAREYHEEIILVGDKECVERELAKHDTTGLNIKVTHAAEHILMTDVPSQVARTKPNSSMHIASQMVKDGQADAFVTAGHTGAALAITTLLLHRIRGIKRAALTALIMLHERPIILTDVGANADCRPEWLVQFALMGSVYAENALGLENARIGLLSIGEEAGKGNQTARESHDLLKQTTLNYVGNVEPKEVLGGAVDVMVTDGFAGNIFAKGMEALAAEMMTLIRAELKVDLRSRIGGALSKPAFRRVKKQIDPFEIGGAPLLGVNGVVIIGHGRSNALAVKNMIRQARLAVAGNIVEAIQNRLADEKDF